MHAQNNGQPHAFNPEGLTQQKLQAFEDAAAVFGNRYQKVKEALQAGGPPEEGELVLVTPLPAFPTYLIKRSPKKRNK